MNSSCTSARTAMGSRSSGSPQPPPPPVRTITSVRTGTAWCAPPATRKSRSPGSRTRYAPYSPGSPPHRPQGGHWLLRTCSKFHFPSTRLRTCMSMPSPPRYFPAPPESVRNARASTRTGHLSSMPSIEPLRTSPWHTDTVPDSPSSNGRPPQPPPSMLCTTKRRLVCGCMPKNTTEPPSRAWWPAGTRSGMAGASAATMVSTTIGTITLKLDIGAGKRAIMTLPSGIITLSARKEPSLTESSAPLLRAAREIDGHRAMVDRDLGADGNRFVAGDAVLVEGGFGLVNAIGELRHHVAAFRFGLVEDAPDRLEHGIAAVFAEQLLHAPRREPARRHLRLHVAERGFRKTDVVLEHAIERLVELARFVDLELIELQSLDPRVGDGRAGAEAGAHAADVDPMCPHHGEHQQLAGVKVGRVDDDVVEVLPRDRLVIGDDDVAGREALPAVAPHAVGDDDAEIGDEMRHPADVLADQLAGGIDQRGAEVAHLVDHHVVGGALQIDRHLVGDRGQRIADDFERDGIEGGGHLRASL